MYIKSLCIEDDNRQIVTSNPSWEQVKNAILSLNGRNRNTVMLEKNNEEQELENDINEFMSISGGGENKLYICTFHSDVEGNGEIEMYDPDKPFTLKDTIEIARVFPGFYPLAQCFNIDKILVAAEIYSRYGKRDKSFHWGCVSFDESSKIKITQVTS
ncbi:MAG: hypothetical protein AAF383_00920 [Cyanobacteria bacterium P01_A01_bin.83]